MGRGFWLLHAQIFFPRSCAPAMEESFTSHPFSLAVSLLSVLLFLIALSKSRPKSARLPPSPPSLPVIGHLHLIRPPIHQSLHRLNARYGPLLHLRLGSTRCVSASSPDLARELLKTHDATFSNRPQSVATRHFAYDTPGFAFGPYNPYWRFMKKLCMSELLGSRTVDRLRPVRRAELLGLLRTMLAKSRSREPVNVSMETIKMTNNEITRMAVSTTSEEEGEEARYLVKQVAELVGAFNLEDFIGLCRGLDIQGLGKRIREVHRRFDAFIERIVKGKEARRKQRREVGSGEEDGVKDLLDILLDVAEDEKAEMKLTRENIKGFIMDLITSGSDSSAATTEWALAELVNHPPVLRKLREEIEQVIGKDRIVDETDVPNLPYLQAVVKEAMRLHPGAPLVIRESSKDIKVAGYDIPANTTLFVNLWSIGRDPGYWENPLEFRPERFTVRCDEVIDLRGQQFQLIPFGSGRRGCPGINLGLHVVHVTVAAMAQCFEWEVGGDEPGKAGVDMEEGAGLVIPRAHPLVIIPKARLDPLPVELLTARIR